MVSTWDSLPLPSMPQHQLSPHTLYWTRSINTDNHALEMEVLVCKAFLQQPCGSGKIGRIVPCRLEAWPHLFTSTFPKMSPCGSLLAKNPAKGGGNDNPQHNAADDDHDLLLLGTDTQKNPITIPLSAWGMSRMLQPSLRSPSLVARMALSFYKCSQGLKGQKPKTKTQRPSSSHTEK